MVTRKQLNAQQDNLLYPTYQPSCIVVRATASQYYSIIQWMIKVETSYVSFYQQTPP